MVVQNKVLLYLLVFLGSGIGGLFRFFISNSVSPFYPSFPMGTLIVNLLGMFFVGLLSVWFIEKNLVQSPIREMILIGFLGGFTTFSTFGNESFSLLNQNRYPELFFYLSGNLFLGFGLLLIGRNLATR